MAIDAVLFAMAEPLRRQEVVVYTGEGASLQITRRTATSLGDPTALVVEAAAAVASPTLTASRR